MLPSCYFPFVRQFCQQNGNDVRYDAYDTQQYLIKVHNGTRSSMMASYSTSIRNTVSYPLDKARLHPHLLRYRQRAMIVKSVCFCQLAPQRRRAAVHQTRRLMGRAHERHRRSPPRRILRCHPGRDGRALHSVVPRHVVPRVERTVWVDGRLLRRLCSLVLG